jgi:hypothetical protein
LNSQDASVSSIELTDSPAVTTQVYANTNETTATSNQSYYELPAINPNLNYVPNPQDALSATIAVAPSVSSNELNNGATSKKRNKVHPKRKRPYEPHEADAERKNRELTFRRIRVSFLFYQELPPAFKVVPSIYYQLLCCTRSQVLRS